MRTPWSKSWRARLATGGAVLAGLTLAAAPAAAQESQPSQPAPAPVTVTLSPEQVSWLCERRLPKVEKRVTKLVERINGGPEVRGSTEWLRAKAAKEREAGRDTTADLLDERAERRAGKVEQLDKIKQWVADFRGQHCGGAK